MQIPYSFMQTGLFHPTRNYFKNQKFIDGTEAGNSNGAIVKNDEKIAVEKIDIVVYELSSLLWEKTSGELRIQSF